MRMISRRPLCEFCTKHADARVALQAWYAEARSAVWKTPQDIKNRYGSASFPGNDRPVFNIYGNKYRVVIHIRYTFEVVYILFIGTHPNYDRINAEKI